MSSPPFSSSSPSFQQKRRVPSSPHKPLTTKTFYDLTKSNSSSPEILKTAISIDLTESPPISGNNPRILKQMTTNVPDVEAIRGPFAKYTDQKLESPKKSMSSSVLVC